MHMSGIHEKENALKPGYVILLLGFFYINIRLIAECFMQYQHIGRRAFMVLWGDNPVLISMTDILTAIISILGMYYIIKALSSKDSAKTGLLLTSTYLLAFFFFTAKKSAPECLLFSHWILLNSMIAILLVFIIYLVISSLFKKQRI